MCINRIVLVAVSMNVFDGKDLQYTYSKNHQTAKLNMYIQCNILLTYYIYCIKRDANI